MKIYTLDQEAKIKIKSGIDKVCNAVKLTIGPAGRNAIIGRPMQNPLITNDGITIAKEFMLEDEIEQLGVQIVQEALKSANEVSGDGTTTTTVLIQAILAEAFKILDPHAFEKANPMKLRKQIDDACKLVVSHLKPRQIKTKKDIAKVASISVESEYIGGLIADVFDKLGKDALITVQDGFSKQIETETVLGTDIEGGLMNDYFANNDKKEYVEDFPIVFTTNRRLNTVKDIEAMLKYANDNGKKSLVIVAEHFEKSLLDIMLHNKLTGQFTVIPIKVPTSDKSFILKDLALLLNGELMDSEIEGKAGTCQKIVVSDGKTIFLGTREGINTVNLKEQMEKADSLYDKDKLKKRIQKLSGGVGVIRVDAQTETEKEYLKLKIEDAINATRCALEEGVVKGGGLALKEISDIIEPNILTEALKAPYKQIQENAGGIEIGDEVVDPVKVIRTSLEKACSIVGMVITTEIAINDKKEEKE